MPGSVTRANALDHVVVVLFENRSLDNVLGRLYGPGDGKVFEGVIGKELSNPIPGWAEHGADRKVVPYGATAGLDSPNPDSGEEWYHTNTQLFGVIDDHNRFKIGEGVTAPWNAPPPGAVPAMDGFVADYISTFTGEVGRQPAYEEYAQIMTGYTPQQLPVLSGIARDPRAFGDQTPQPGTPPVSHARSPAQASSGPQRIPRPPALPLPPLARPLTTATKPGVLPRDRLTTTRQQGQRSPYLCPNHSLARDAGGRTQAPRCSLRASSPATSGADGLSEPRMKVRAVSATSCHPSSMVSAWPRPGISVNSVTPGFFCWRVYAAWERVCGAVWSFSPGSLARSRPGRSARPSDPSCWPAARAHRWAEAVMSTVLKLPTSD